MSDLIQRLSDREARYQLAHAEAVHVTVERESDDERFVLDAQLLDLSQGGARLRSQVVVDDAETLTITIDVPSLSQPVVVRGQVCWMALAPKASFYVGCSIEPAIPQVLLDHLAGSGILERRNEDRQETSITVSARSELDPTEWEASILNISPGGLCLLTSRKGDPGRRICLTMQDENQKSVQVFVKARWQVDIEGEYVIGCDISDQGSWLRLKRIADAHAAEAMESASA